MTRLDAGEITALYRRCYAGPPWSEPPEQLDAYPDRLAEALERPDFNAWVERDHEGRLIGICYGWPTPADLSGSRIYDMLRDSFGAPAVSRMTAGSFEVVELFVHPEARGKGIASRLLAQATAGWPKAWLITSPQAPAARLYHRLGWQEAGPLPGDPPLALFTLEGDQRMPQEY
ncbi:GNAT superfamily N-acetyltransferase [Nonomuraea thailandensis]|uniref:GNAT superfamily N-acetyltransferase n=1 Tax=Nonomuraea thailandensis TaxID=1188745 RepID=A0A9X2K212_9ACTN|nr:GNAT family N-acetyltransferase [Nonomuraea thailandensis]MCP2356904.1 GNAT superfamily N-acetyltransferase [Nonomuraea thailandensis]